MQSKFFTLCFVLVFALGSLPAQTAFWTETFADSTASITNWTNGGTNDGTEIWKWSSNISYGGFGVNFAAPTAENGFFYFDSDLNDVNEHNVTLTSPRIDCSGQNQVFLELFTQYAYYFQDSSIVQIGVSTDGLNYTYRDVLTEVDPNFLFESAQRVVMELPEAANQSGVHLQIRWKGFNEWFLLLDDLSLFNTEPILTNDLAIFANRFPATFQTPISQVDSMFFIGSARNQGADPQTNVHLRTTILDPSQNPVFLDSSEKTNILAAGALDTFSIENGFLPSAVGNYFAFQSVSGDEDDDFTSNNRQIYRFQVSEDVFAVDDGSIQNASAPTSFSTDFWEGGNLYYVKNGQGFEAHNVQFSIFSSNESHIGKTIGIFLYKIVDDGEAGFTDDDVDIVGFSNYTLGSDDGNIGLITAPILQEDGETVGIALEDSTDYILMLSLPQDISISYTHRDLIYDIGSVVKDGSDWFLGGFTGPIALIVRMGIRPAMDVPTKEVILPDSQISSFPNPASNLYQIDLELERTSNVQVRLLNLAGQVILQKEYLSLQQDRIKLDISELPAATYFVKVQTEEGVKTLKLNKI